MPAEPLSAARLLEGLSSLPAWTLADDALHRELRCRDFRSAMAFLLRVAFEAEALGHHPEVFCVYDRVRFTLRTHEAGGRVTERDLELAQRIEAVWATVGW